MRKSFARFVCFDCRKVFSRPHNFEAIPPATLEEKEECALFSRSLFGSAPSLWHRMTVCRVKCPQCSSSMHDLGRNFKTPLHNDLKQWRKIRLLYQNGWRGYGWNVSPRMTLQQTREYLADKSSKERASQIARKQELQNEKWLKMRKWPRVHK